MTTSELELHVIFLYKNVTNRHSQISYIFNSKNLHVATSSMNTGQFDNHGKEIIV